MSREKFRSIRLAGALSLFAFSAAAVEVSGVPLVSDGDTIRIGESRIRLFGIDAPEGNQTCERDAVPWLCGQEAGKYLRELVAAQSLLCAEIDHDRYGRTVAICRLSDGRDIGAEMVAAGMAIAYRQYGGSTYDAAEAEAKKFRRGLWSGKFRPPWEWRRKSNRKPAP